MVRGTTPTLKFGIPFNRDAVEALYVTFDQAGSNVMEKKFDDVVLNDKEIILRLSQEDTLKLKEDVMVEIQVRVKTTDGGAFASNIIRTSVGRILKDGQI